MDIGSRVGEFFALIESQRFDEVVSLVASEVRVKQHVVTLTRPDGKSASTDVCVVVRFDDQGRIVRLDEYADSAVFASLYG